MTKLLLGHALVLEALLPQRLHRNATRRLNHADEAELRRQARAQAGAWARGALPGDEQRGFRRCLQAPQRPAPHPRVARVGGLRQTVQPAAQPGVGARLRDRAQHRREKIGHRADIAQRRVRAAFRQAVILPCESEILALTLAPRECIDNLDTPPPSH